MSHRIHEPNHAGKCIFCGKYVGKDMDKPAKSVANDPVLFNGKDIRTVYPISTFRGTTQDELVELIRQVQVRAQVNRDEDAYGVQVRAQVEVQDEMTVEVGE